MKERKGHQISKRGILGLQRDKRTTGYTCPNLSMSFEDQISFYIFFGKKGMYPNVGHIKCSV